MSYIPPGQRKNRVLRAMPKRKERPEFEVMIGNSGVETFEADTKAGAYKKAVEKHCDKGEVPFMKMTEAVITKQVLPLFKEAIEDDKDGTMGEIATTLAYFFLSSGDADVVDVDEGDAEDLADNFSGADGLPLEEAAEKLFKKNKAKGVAKFKKNLLTLCRSGVFYLRFLNEPQVLFCNPQEVFEGVYDLFGTQTTSWNSSAIVESLKEANGKLIPFLTYDRKKIASDPEYKEKFLNIMLPTAYSSNFSKSAEAKEYFEKFYKPREEDTKDEEEETTERDPSSNIYIERLDKATEENKLEGIGNYTSQLIHIQVGYDNKSSGAFSQRNTGGYDEVYLLEDNYGAAGIRADKLWNENLGAVSLLTGYMDVDTDDEDAVITEGVEKALQTAGDLGFILQDAFENIASLEEELQGRDTDKETDVDNSDFQEQGKEAFDFFWDAKKPSFPKDLDFLDDEEKNAVYNLAQYVAILKDTSDQEALVLSAQIYDDGIFPLVEELYRLGKESKTSRQELGGRFDRVKELEDRVRELETELVETINEKPETPVEEEKSEFTDVSRLLKEIADLTQAREKEREEINKVKPLEIQVESLNRMIDNLVEERDEYAVSARELEEKLIDAKEDDEDRVDRTDDFDALFTILEQLGVDVDEVIEEVKDADGIFEFLQSEKYTEMVIEPIERGLFT